ncbi:hypothetical protein MASR1M36_13180 [Candidatus Cloacimonadaceae bacterium]
MCDITSIYVPTIIYQHSLTDIHRKKKSVNQTINTDVFVLINTGRTEISVVPAIIQIAIVMISISIIV